MNPKDSSYSLRDDFYRHVQRDWPGYNEEEKQLVSRLLSRWARGRGSHMDASYALPLNSLFLCNVLYVNVPFHFYASCILFINCPVVLVLAHK